MQNNATETTGGSSIRRSSGSGGSRPRKKKKNQLPIGFGVLTAMIIIGVLLGLKNGTLALYWAFGCCFGFTLQKSRFCFTASLRDPCITGSTSITRAVLIAFAITTIGFTAIKYGAYVNGQEIPGQSYIMPISLATAVGGIMFGIGMVIAMQMLSLLFFVIGSLIGANHMGWWTENFIAAAPRIFLPDIFGWAGAVILQLLIIGMLYIAADLYEKKRMGITED